MARETLRTLSTSALRTLAARFPRSPEAAWAKAELSRRLRLRRRHP